MDGLTVTIQFLDYVTAKFQAPDLYRNTTRGLTAFGTRTRTP